MKKILCLLLCTVLTLSLLACGGSANGGQETEATPALRVGFGRSAFTPEAVVQLSNQALSKYSMVLEDVYVTCLAFTDAEGDNLLLFSCDMIRGEDNIRMPILREVEKATGISVDNMVFSCTHNHNGPQPGAVVSELKKAAVAAATEALADQAAATVSVGTTYTYDLSFVRHYVKEDGAYTGAAYTSASSAKTVAHERDPDNTMQLLRLDREGKKPILMMNWQCHAVYTYETDYLSSDFIGPTRRAVEENTDCLFAFFQGAAGNINYNSWFTEKNRFPLTVNGMEQYGQALAQTAISQLDKLTQVNCEGIDISQGVYTATVHQDSAEYLAAIDAFKQVYDATGDARQAAIASGDMVHGRISLTFPSKRTALGQTNDIPIVVFRIGEVGFISAPYEMFDSSGKAVRDQSPFDTTWVIGYTGFHRYIPTAECIEHMCYEWECGLYEKGTAEALVDAFVAQLKTLPQ